MYKSTSAMLALALAACVASPAAVKGNPKASSESLKASQALASANAVHPGDVDMSCDAIQAELAGMMNDPQYRSVIASMGARAADQKAKIDGAMATHSSKSSADAASTAHGTAADLETIMPQVMRSQRLTTLAQARRCAFLPETHKR